MSPLLLLILILPALTGPAYNICNCAAGDVSVLTLTDAHSAVETPMFADKQHTQIVTALGQNVTLECDVLHLGDKTVSWVRSRDLQILAHGGVVFTGDPRVRAGETNIGGGVSRHTLTVQRARSSDIGRYECQLNTEPKMSLYYSLVVLDYPMPKVRVRIERVPPAQTKELAVSQLSCEASYYPPPPSTDNLPSVRLTWYYEGMPIDLQTWGGVSIEHDSWQGGARSLLALGPQAPSGGLFTCRTTPPNDDAFAEIMLPSDDWVVETMQHDEALIYHGKAACMTPTLVLLAALVISVIVR